MTRRLPISHTRARPVRPDGAMRFAYCALRRLPMIAVGHPPPMRLKPHGLPRSLRPETGHCFTSTHVSPFLDIMTVQDLRLEVRRDGTATGAGVIQRGRTELRGTVCSK